MPRKLIVTENMTVDSVVDMAGDWFVPPDSDSDPAEHADMLEVEERLRSSADALLVGRITFEEFRGFWPHQVDDPTGVRDYLDQVDKYVVSRTLTDPGWSGTTVLRGDLAEEVARLKAGQGGDIVTTGSITLVHALTRLGLVDEYRLFVYPTVVGRGRQLFEPTGPHRLALLEARPFRHGVVLLRYRPE